MKTTRLKPGARVALTEGITLWPAGTRGTVAERDAYPLDYWVELDCAPGMTFAFRASELRPA